MKEKGYKHEDELMKENAKLQVRNCFRSMRRSVGVFSFVTQGQEYRREDVA